MKIEDIPRSRPTALPDCIVIPGAIEVCPEPSENTTPAGTRVAECMPVPTLESRWPRVFPGL